jgi:hypothetical protein
MTDTLPRFKDFSLSEEPVVFQIGADAFPCHPEVALDTLTELAGLSADTNDRSNQMQRIHDFFDFIIADPGMAAKFRARTAAPTEENPNPKPIGLRHILPIMQWLMEVYGLRPTQPSSDSADSSSNDEVGSTESSSETALIS